MFRFEGSAGYFIFVICSACFMENLKPTRPNGSSGRESQNLKPNNGFTLVELLAVAAITVLLSTIILASTREPTKKLDVRRAAQIVAADMRRAQGMALSAESVSCASGTLVPYYGFRVQSGAALASYLLFADCNKDNQYSAADDLIVGQETLDKVAVAATVPVSGGADFLEIVYAPPVPTIAIDGSTYAHPAVGTFSIQLCHSTDASICKTVSGNTRGNVEIK